MSRILQHLEIPALIIAPCALLLCAYLQIEQSSIITLIFVILTLLIFFAGFESSKPALRQIMPTVVLAALASAGRILFAPIPDFKPVSAICIMAGAVFGKRCGFMVGALAALCSNFFFGQGPWTPWQMYAWGMIGYLAGILGQAGIFGETKVSHTTSGNNLETATTPTALEVNKINVQPQDKEKVSEQQLQDEKTSPKQQAQSKNPTVRRTFSLSTLALISYGFLSGVFFGFILNSYYLVGFVIPVSWQGALAVYLSGLPFDIIHGIATVVFLLALFVPWKRKLERIKVKYGL